MATQELTVQVPAFISVPRADFEEGLVIISAPDLDEMETDQLRDHIIDQLGPDAKSPSLVVVNFDTEVVVLDEDQMRKMGWVRADTR